MRVCVFFFFFSLSLSSLPVELWYHLMSAVMWFIGGYSCFTWILAWTGLLPRRAADPRDTITRIDLSSNWPLACASPWQIWVHVHSYSALNSKMDGLCFSFFPSEARGQRVQCTSGGGESRAVATMIYKRLCHYRDNAVPVMTVELKQCNAPQWSCTARMVRKEVSITAGLRHPPDPSFSTSCPRFLPPFIHIQVMSAH